MTTDEPSPDFGAFRETNAIDVPVYHDLSRALTLAFRNAGTPQFYVVDAAGAIRFPARSEADEARLQDQS